LKKDDFNLYNGFFMEKRPEFNRFLRRRRKNSKLPDYYYDKFQ
jgi:hypothetical protein